MENERHLSLTDEQRLKLLTALKEDEFNSRMSNDPIAAMAELDINLTQDDLDELADRRITVPSAEDIRENFDKYRGEIEATGLIFGFGGGDNWFCIFGES